MGAIAAISASFFTASATADSRVGEIDTKVQVLQERQLLQYTELKESLIRIEDSLIKLSR